MKKILVITREKDLHCDFVVREIRELGGDIIRINTDNIAEQLSYCFNNHGNDSFTDFLIIGDSQLTFTSQCYDTIWYRKPLPIDVSHLYDNKQVYDFINTEYSLFIKEFYHLNGHKRWINDIGAMDKAGCKLQNLNLASRLGLTIPKTIVTNLPSEAEKFARSCNWNIIVKAFRANGITYNDKLFLLYSNKVSREEFEAFKASIPLCPALLQEYIDKKVELRVTIFGDEVFAAAIHSQEQDASRLDFRAGNLLNIKHTIYPLPEQISRALLAFNRHYRLSFSTFDLIVTPDNEYVFLECNPNGQWYWIEEMTGLPISVAMARLLIGS